MRRRVANGVVQQIAGQFPQHPVVGAHPGGDGLNSKIQVFGRNQGRHVKRHFAQHHGPVHLAVGCLCHQLGDLGQRQHLVGQPGGTRHGVVYFMQGLCGGDIAPQCRLHLHLQHRQRRAQLVRGVAHKPFLVVQQVAQAGHKVVVGLDQAREFSRCIGGLQRGQVVFRAGLQLGA